jgi:hypothetical protein
MRTKAGAVQKRWMRVTSAVEYSDISRSRLFQMRKDGRLTPHKPSPKVTLIDRLELDEYLECTATAALRIAGFQPAAEATINHH